MAVLLPRTGVADVLEFLGELVHTPLLIPPVIGEVWLVAHLLVKNVRAVSAGHVPPVTAATPVAA